MFPEPCHNVSSVLCDLEDGVCFLCVYNTKQVIKVYNTLYQDIFLFHYSRCVCVRVIIYDVIYYAHTLTRVCAFWVVKKLS